MTDFDTIVVGLGAMGGATLHQLARRGGAVLGIDRFAPPHDHGSSHGDTRITRLAIGEGDHLTPLVQRSHQLWRQIEAEADADLFTVNGELIISSPARTATTHVENFFEHTLAAARDHGIAHERLDAGDIRRRFPQFAVRDNETGYYEPGAGFVRVERALRAQLDLASRHGAQIHTGETFTGWRREAGGVRVTTDKAAYTAGKLILAAGPWMPQLLGRDFAGLFRVLRQVLFWFEVSRNFDRFVPARCPVFIWELQTGDQVIYGFPAIDGPKGGVKLATEQYLEETAPDALRREVGADEIAAMYDTFIAPHLPDLGSDCVRTAACLYTLAPDAGFVIDRHPDCGNVIIVSACSGHGFKHSPAIGEALAQLVCDGASGVDLAPFRLDRLTP